MCRNNLFRISCSHKSVKLHGSSAQARERLLHTHLQRSLVSVTYQYSLSEMKEIQGVITVSERQRP